MAGKGISDAVRGAVREWMTDKTVSVLYEEYKKVNNGRGSAFSETVFSSLIRDADRWVRIKRLRGYTGWVRTYYSKQFADRSVTLEVNSNEADTMIEYVTVKVGRKLIGGGKVKVPSVLMSQSGRRAKLDLELAFTPFSESELQALQAEMEHGTAAVHALLFEERFV